MVFSGLLFTLLFGLQDPGNAGSRWVPLVSRDGNFTVDFPGKPTKSSTRQMRSRGGMVKAVVIECDTPDVLYVAEKIDLPATRERLKASDYEAILDYWSGHIADLYNGKILTQKKLRLDTGAYGRDFTIEGRPDPKGGLAMMRVREYLAQRVLYILVASTASDRELPEDVGHYFASFSPGTNRTKKVGPQPEPEGKPLGEWGQAIDPDGDCKIEDQGKALQIAVPGTHHDLNADNNKLNAPRVMREVSGDFSVTVKVDGTFKPSSLSTNPKAVPYIGGGIVVWQDSDNYIFLGRAAIWRSNRISEFAAFEEREWGTRGALNNRGIEPGGVYLRVERRNNRVLGYTSKDGKNWARLDPMETSYPATLKVGLYAINGCTEPITVRFEDFRFTEGRPAGTAKTGAGKAARKR
jgi:regulation of enolase protein 1 (concanavalin A-like superfamily)